MAKKRHDKGLSEAPIIFGFTFTKLTLLYIFSSKHQDLQIPVYTKII